MPQIPARAQALVRLTETITRQAAYNDSIPRYARQRLAVAPAGERRSTIDFMQNIVGRPDLAGRNVGTSGLNLDALGKDPELASFVAGVHAAVARYETSVTAAHTALHAMG